MSESSEPQVSLVVPVYNEAENIEPLHEAIGAALEGIEYETVLVNDGSNDGSKAVLDSLASRDPKNRVIHFRIDCRDSPRTCSNHCDARRRFSQ